MTNIMMNNNETNIDISARSEVVLSASLEETENESFDHVDGEIESGDVYEEWRKMMNELDLAVSDIVHSVSKAEDVRGEAEKTLELMISERGRLEEETHEIPAIEATAIGPADTGEERSNTDLAPEEAVEQAEESGGPTDSEIDQVEAAAKTPLAIQSRVRVGYDCKSCGRSFDLAQRLAFHERTHASAQATLVAEQPAETTPTVDQTPLADNDQGGNVAELAPEELQEDDSTLSKIDPREIAPPVESRVEPMFLELCMSNPRFRASVISRIVKKLG